MKKLLWLSVLAASTALAQSSTISGLASGSPAQSTDAFPVARAGANFKLTSADIATFARGTFSGNTVGAASSGVTKLFVDFTNTGTVGAVTINKASGRVNIAAAGSTVVVTNSFSTAATHCFVNLQGAADTTMKSASCDTSTPAQITIRGNAAATAQVAIDFFLVNAD